MFIFIGNDEVLHTDKIISILDAQLLSSFKKVKHLMEQKTITKEVHGDQVEAKSIIITDEAIYYSPLSILTLKKREELYATIDQLESY